MNKTHLLSALLALVLGAASARSTAPTLPDGTFASSLKQLASSGVKITLLNAEGKTVATISTDGTLSLVEGFTLADATTVKAGSVSYQGANGPKVTLPLIAAINRDAAAARAAAARQNAAKTSSAASSAKPTNTTAKPAARTAKPDTAG